MSENDATVDRSAATTPLRPDDVVQSLRAALELSKKDVERWKDKAEELAVENATCPRLRAAEDTCSRAQHDLHALKEQVADKVGELAALVGDADASSPDLPRPGAQPAEVPAEVSGIIDPAFDAKATVLHAQPREFIPPSVSVSAQTEVPASVAAEVANASALDFEDDGTVEVHAQIARTTLDSEALQSPAPLASIASDTDPEGKTRHKG